MAKDRYEISLWDDVFVAASGNVPGHYEEEKIAIIGSDSMTTQCRAIEPKLVCNVNGKVTFTFKMYYRYHDELTGEDYDNPFLKLLVNERKVKVLWLGEWYDLIIKNIQESSNGKTVVYTCEDANINELAKTGFNLIFDDDLSYNNVEGGNQGTVEELVERTIAGTDWVLGAHDNIQQFTEEAVYEVTALRGFTGYDMAAATSVGIGEGKKILVFYPQLADMINGAVETAYIKPFYFAYDSTQEYSKLAKTEMLVQATCCALGSDGSITCVCTFDSNTNILEFGTATGGPIGQFNVNQVSTQYRANRLVKEPLTLIEPHTEKYCYVYKATASGEDYYTNNIIYETVEPEFKDASYATNLVANGTNFMSTDGWEYPSGAPLSLDIYPTPSVASSSEGNSTIYLMMPTSGNDARYYYNDAIRANRKYFSEGCQTGERYIFRIKAKSSPNGSGYRGANDINLIPDVRKYFENTSSNTNCKWPVALASGGVRYFKRSDPVNIYEEGVFTGWVEFTLTCQKTFTASEILSENIGLFITQPSASTAYARAIEAVEFFKYVEGENGKRIDPGQLNALGVAQTVYTYYRIVTSDNTEEIRYLYHDIVDWNNPDFQQQYNDNFSKIRSINIKQSNRFNILQTIAETFECWVRFYVPHNRDTGYLNYIDGVPEKYVTISREMGEERSIGFVYGIDLQSIQRTIESNSIVTKTIVLENNNEFGKNGTCRISRSKFNYPAVDYVLNFDYYINHNLLNGSELMRDLYARTATVTADGPINARAYYRQLHDWNIEYEEKSQQNADYQLALLKDEGLKTTYSTMIEAAKEQIKNVKKSVCEICKTSAYSNQSTQTRINQILNNPSSEFYKELKGDLEVIEAQSQLIKKYSDIITNLNTAIAEYNNRIQGIQSRLDQLKKYITLKTELFNKKYARFISEGSWTDSKYYDDNLYYLDANSIAYTSSRPKVSYNISVVRVTGIDGFKIKDFSLGDISYIEDTEFFGYTYIQNGQQQVKTPYREKVVITEVTYNFDEPNKDTFKVQNYRTQFEDLFQRIAAQTQSLQYSTGIYNKTADIIKTDSTIKKDVLKASFDANSDVLDRTSINNMVTTDDNGITVTNIQNASEAVRVTSGGLFITTDGGDSWQNAIRGDGIGTQYLTSGAIDTKKIQIYGEDGDTEGAVAFKWDATGINAYDKDGADEGYAYNSNRFVRFFNEGISVYTTTSSQGTNSYEKLKLGKLSQGQYGLQINSYVNNAVSTAFRANDNGDLFIAGEVSAKSGDIGGWTINSTNLMKTTTISGTPYEVLLSSFIGNDPGSSVAIAVRSVHTATPTNRYVFRVRYDGSLLATNADITGTVTANSGNIGGWTIDSTHIQNYASDASYRVGMYGGAAANSGNRAFYVADETGTSTTYPFSVKYDGSLTATKANITGTISAAAGTIGGLTIEEKFLHNGASAASATAVDSTALVLSGGQEFSRNINGTERDHLRFALGSGFGVSTGGRLYASNAVISGDITATSLTLTGGAKVAAADVSGTLTAAYIDGSHINAGSISAGKINGEGLVITGTGQFGSFVIGYDGQYSSINAGDTKISSYRVITPVVKPTTTLDLSECQIYNGSIHQYAKWKSFSTLASTDLVLVGSNNP